MHLSEVAHSLGGLPVVARERGWRVEGQISRPIWDPSLPANMAQIDEDLEPGRRAFEVHCPGFVPQRFEADLAQGSVTDLKVDLVQGEDAPWAIARDIHR